MSTAGEFPSRLCRIISTALRWWISLFAHKRDVRRDRHVAGHLLPRKLEVIHPEPHVLAAAGHACSSASRCRSSSIRDAALYPHPRVLQKHHGSGAALTDCPRALNINANTKEKHRTSRFIPILHSDSQAESFSRTQVRTSWQRSRSRLAIPSHSPAKTQRTPPPRC